MLQEPLSPAVLYHLGHSSANFENPILSSGNVDLLCKHVSLIL